MSVGVAGRIGHMVPIRFPAVPLCGVPVFVPSLRTAMIESGTVETGDESMKDLVEFIAKSLADKPEEVEVREVEGDQVRVLELRVAKEDLGKIIGKQGRTARALRTIVSAASAKAQTRLLLEIQE